jgi:hypothetical protein
MSQGFSIERILLVVFLIVLVLSIILPLFPHRPNIYAYNVKQKADFHGIDVGLELFESEFGHYPPSDAVDEEGRAYCGAMKLCEAIMGQDLKGVHPGTRFRSYGKGDTGHLLYEPNTIGVREGPLLPVEVAGAYRLKDLYKNTGPFDGNEYVLCDVFRNVRHIASGKRVGMPILYYKANTSKTTHDVNDPDNPENIYNYKDNHALIGLGAPGKPGRTHPLYENPRIFYEMTKDYGDTSQSKPKNVETFILLSAGMDGLYGTKDDVANFDIGWKPE